ncbi:MAG TPA: hypothetical protein VMV83_03590 [Rectinemataceae bacterium]|nr:hypothetical protein [Rectinemataceae bacterium]
MSSSLRLLAHIAIPLLLSSCAPPLTFMVSPEAAQVASLVEQAAKGTKGLEGLVFLPDTGPWPSKGLVARLTSTPRWNLPAAVPAVSPISASALPPAYAPLPVFAALGRSSDGSWSALPLFFDAVGFEAYYPAGSAVPPDLPNWDQIGDKRWEGQLALPGGLPSCRQAVFFLGESSLKSPILDAGNWFSQFDADWRAGLARVPEWTTSTAWAPSTWTFTPGDLAVWQKPGSPYVFGTSYRSFEISRGGDPRRFAPWLRRYESGQTALAGTVLFLEVYDGGKAPKQLEPLLRLLCSPDFQKQVGVRLKWMAVSQSTAEIDGDSAVVRDAARAAFRFFPLADRLPQSIPSNNLMGEIQAAFNYAKKR